MIKLSIITVSLNSYSGIMKTLYSSQYLKNCDFEHIVIDGGSTDGTVEYLQLIKKENFIWISEPDNGIYSAMNKGIKLARGKFLLFLNCGDVFCNNLNFDFNRLDNKSIYYFPIYLNSNIDNSKILKEYTSKLSDKFMFVKTLCHQAIIYPREIFRSHIYDESYKYISDWLLNLNLFHLGYNFYYLNYPFVIYDQNGLTGQGKSRLEFLNEKLNVQRKNYPFRYLFYIKINSLLKKIKRLKNIVIF